MIIRFLKWFFGSVASANQHMTICLEVMREDNSVWTLGDVVRVFEPQPNLVKNPQCNMKRKAYIFISDVPAEYFRKLKSMFEDASDDNEMTVRQRENAIETSLLPTQVQRALTQAPYVYQTTWSEIQGVNVKRKKENTLMTVDSLKEDVRYNV